MIPPLADFAPPEPTAFAGFCASAAALVMLAYFTVCLIGKLKAEKTHPTRLVGQPISVSQADKFITAEQFAKLEGEMRGEFAKQAAGRKSIYHSIEEQGRKIVALEAECAHQTRQLNRLDGKMDQLLLRLHRPKAEG
jgi:hypothetical protein